jgi:hypothetical protein
MATQINRIAAACIALAFISTISAQPSSQPSAADTTKWQPIFNGKDTSGWYTYLKGQGKNNDPGKVFQVSDGILHIYKDAEDGSSQPMGYIATDNELGDCRIRLEYKWGTKRFGSRSKAKRDSGLLYFFTGEDGAFGNGPWPYSVECQIQEGDVGDIYCVGTQCSSTIDPKTKNAKQPTFMDEANGGVPFTTPAKGNNRIIRSAMLEKDGWNTLELVLKGDSGVHIVNGQVNMRITNTKAPNPQNKDEMVKVTKGKILLQAEGAEVMYRNIEVAPLQVNSK